MSEYTPGPWTYLGGDLLVDSPYWGQIRSENWDLIAQQPEGDDRHDDFVLMAAAPDLLEAAVELLERVKVEHSIYDLMNIDEEIAAMERAIAKATGADNAARS